MILGGGAGALVHEQLPGHTMDLSRVLPAAFFALLGLLGGGVAWGVLLALTVNFLTMAQLSLSEAKMSWSSYWRAHLPALLITLISSPLVWIVATLFRHLGLPPVFLLATGTAVVGVCSLLLMFLAPATFLGSDGQWMVTTLRSFVQKTAHPAAQPSGTPAVS